MCFFGKRSHHHHCPDSSDSWCRYKHHKANNTNLYKPGPGYPDYILAQLKKIYARLTADDLLRKYLDGTTQN